jgi:hypothetical protein
MVYIMPASKWDDYKDNKQSKLLTDVKDAIKARYPSTEVKVDRLVVAIKYQNFHVEVQPVFNYYDSNDDESGYFKYPDTKNGSSWKNTKPRQEMAAVKDVNEGKKNLRLLCKMASAWKNKHGVGGLCKNSAISVSALFHVLLVPIAVRNSGSSNSFLIRI